MTQINAVACPHCGGSNPTQAAFCQSCGKALPIAVPTGPRVVGASEYATTTAGRKLQADDVRKQAMRASRIFLWVGGVLLLYGIFDFNTQYQLPPQRQYQPMIVLSIGQCIMGALLMGTGFWARRDPLPASIVGLGLYILVTLGYTAFFFYLGRPELITTTLIFRIIVIVVLCRAVGAAIKHRNLTRALNQTIPYAKVA